MQESAQTMGHAVQPWIRPLFWFAAVVLGALQLWMEPYMWHAIGEDGLSYIEIGEAYVQGDWKAAINAYWGPLYSIILGIALRLTGLSLYWESTVVHVVNFFIYLCALGAFDFFLRQLIRYHHEKSRMLAQHGLITFSANGWIALGYGLFIWSSLQWITVRYELADMLLSVFVYLASGILLRIHMGVSGQRIYVLLGIVLGLGYLTKSAMLPLTFIYLGVCWVLIRDRPNAVLRVLRVLLVLTIFLAVGSPYMIAISLAKGRPTFSDTGKLVYVWFANGPTTIEQNAPNWQRQFPDDGRPVHPSRKVLDAPALYEFGSQIGGTYPPWYDPSYWHDGVTPHFELEGQLRSLKRSAKTLARIFFAGAPFLVPGLFICFYVAGRWIISLGHITKFWFLLVPSLSAIGMYALVFLTPRYIAHFVVLLLLGIFSGVRFSNSEECRRLLLAVPVGMLIIMGIHFCPQVYAAARGDFPPQKHWQWEIAIRLNQIGVLPGDKVAYIGYGVSAYWARLAQVKIVAEMPSERDSFLSVENVKEILLENGSLKPEAIQAFVSTGAKAIVSRNVPPAVAKNGWQELGASYYAFLLPSSVNHAIPPIAKP
jgi:hypothetical protein